VLDSAWNEQIPLLDAFASLALDQPLCSPEPAARRAYLPADREHHAEHECRARRAKRFAGAQVLMVEPFEERQVRVRAARHRGGRREQLEVAGSERLGLVGLRQRRVGIQPGPSRIGLAAAIELSDCVHPGKSCASREQT
jgi:hypothetical protein